MNAIACDNLTRAFGAVRAVDGVSFAVPAGRIFTLLGANGAGKTTTIHLLLGLLAPTEGRASVLGLDPSGLDGAQVRARCGVLLEHHGLYERLTAEENLQLGARIARMPAPDRAKRIHELLEHFGLWERRDHVGTFSRGMKQKLAIARAMLPAPALVFLDEPTAGLDPEAVVSLRRDVAALASAQGVTVFLNTHNITDAEKLSDLVGVMRRGRLLAMGTPAELQGDTIITVTGTGLSQQHAEAIGATLVAGGLSIRLRAGERVAPMVRELVSRGVEIEEVRKERAGLESTFLALVAKEDA